MRNQHSGGNAGRARGADCKLEVVAWHGDAGVGRDTEGGGDVDTAVELDAGAVALTADELAKGGCVGQVSPTLNG